MTCEVCTCSRCTNARDAANAERRFKMAHPGLSYTVEQRMIRMGNEAVKPYVDESMDAYLERLWRLAQ